MDHHSSTRHPLSILFGITFFTIGLIIDDVYIVIAGALLIVIWAIIETGEKIVWHIDHPPEPL